MKQKYRQDTYQVMKHMKISASLDKGTPNMEKWNTRVKKEMNDWLAIYRRQNLSVGRQWTSHLSPFRSSQISMFNQ
ncbi:unnamed protein product [Effrenium voratum]|uniref:Uncharacterized protein n=1 Tax=Effrenium voratum TaxID=2562239 RepID=A0AA36I659_9DINO|nr:unnamed protein product [Effrenium voratum]CAJ1381695.1 unnamed protein product [Effrenium voratum]